MTKGEREYLYKVFGSLVRSHREQLPDMTQEKLAKHVGLSRTSITNIEKGRQQVGLHQLFVFANALRVRPEALLPSPPHKRGDSWVTERISAKSDEKVAEWARRIVED